jgi:hypothetical protein
MSWTISRTCKTPKNLFLEKAIKFCFVLYDSFHHNQPRKVNTMEIKQIAAALVKAQKAFGPALKSSSNPHFKSRYADLAACVEAVMDSLNDNGIALVQQTHECEAGVMVETIFVHESGEIFSAGKLHVPAVKHDAQGYGSALTYARRYSLMAACGIAPEDDDGNAASKRTPAPVAGYGEFEASTLPAMREAALQGSEALAAAFQALPKSAHKASFWQAQGPALKKAAKTADEQGAA